MPRWLSVLFAPAAAPLSPLSRYTRANGWFYLLTGATFYVAPGLCAFIPGMAPFVGFEDGLVRALGMTLAIIGWFYLVGARENSERVGLATVLDRIFVPVLLLPLVYLGKLQAPLGITFSILDPLLGFGAFVVWSRGQKQ